jgi:DNA-binding NarL/FixJ family response regulator
MLNILVLEDQPGWEALIVSAVRNSQLPDCQVLRAATYAEAVKLIRQQPIQAAILDYTIERAGSEGAKNGLDVAAELRAVAPNALIMLITMVDPERVHGRCTELHVHLIEKGSPELEDDVIRELVGGLAHRAATSR